MLNESDLLQALRHHREYSGKDEDVCHEIYHDDEVLELTQSGERFEGVENFREWRRPYPSSLKFFTRRITHRDDPGVLHGQHPMLGTPGRGRGDKAGKQDAGR
ncbi:MAG: SnoaL-like protein [Micrococcaceae bacterium]|nr:SnoaL-like protein [Micrococcaceae bacterium]